MRNGAVRLEPDIVEQHVLPSAKPARCSTERERVADQRPGDADNGERTHTHHHRVERVLGADETAVEEAGSRSHEQHECGADQHPRGVCRYDDGHVLEGKATIGWLSM